MLQRVSMSRAALLVLFAAAGLSCGDAGPTSEDTSTVVGVEVVAETTTLDALGARTRYIARAINAFGDIVGGKTFHWASSNLLVARVDDDGWVEAVGNGDSDITASVDGVTGGVRVTVEQAFFRLTFDPGPADALAGESSGNVRVRAEDAGGSPLWDANGTVTLSATPTSPGRLVGGPRNAPMVRGEATFLDVRLAGTGSDYRLEATWEDKSGVSLPFDVVTALDVVTVSNVPDPLVDEMGILVDGLRSGAALNDFPVTTLSATTDVGVVESAGAGGNDEVIVFAPDRRTGLARSVEWTPGVDTVEVTLGAPLEIDVTIWIVKGPFAGQANHARSAIGRTRTIWNAERVGVVIDSVEIIDATANANASKYHDLTLCNSQSGLEQEIGHVEGQINVYWVGTVDSGTRRGRACPIGGDHIIMAEETGDELLSHEIGHSFSLTHTDAITDFFDQSNVMHSASSVRRYLSEGQVFRQQFNPNSMLNGILGYRTGEARACTRGAANARCPSIEARIWADGSFPSTLVRGAAEPHGAEASAAGAPTNGMSAAASRSGPLPTRPGGADPVARWVEIECEMDENEGLSARVLEMGDDAALRLAEIATGEIALPGRGPAETRHRVAALDGLVLLGSPAARSALERIAREGPADLRGAALERLERVR